MISIFKPIVLDGPRTDGLLLLIKFLSFRFFLVEDYRIVVYVCVCVCVYKKWVEGYRIVVYVCVCLQEVGGGL